MGPDPQSSYDRQVSGVLSVSGSKVASPASVIVASSREMKYGPGHGRVRHSPALVAVTTATPPNVKRLLGGAAYSLMGVIMAVNFQPYEGRLVLPDAEHELRALVGAVGNGRQAGGGQVLAPRAYIDDGLLDVLVVREFPMDQLGAVVAELENLTEDGEYISYHQVPWLESHSVGQMPINLDGEPIAVESVRFEVLPAAVRLVVPTDCPLLCNQGKEVG